MKQQLKGFISGFAIAGCLFGICIPAVAAARTAVATYSGAAIYLDGQRLTGADPIEINGTTYLPLRLVGESLDLTVDWNGSTKTITLTSQENDSSDSDDTDDNVTISKEIILTPGNYTAGEDFPAGTYDFVALSGGGNAMSSNSMQGGINAILGVDDDSDFYQPEYKGVKLPKGTTLTITSSLKVQLVPRN